MIELIGSALLGLALGVCLVAVLGLIGQMMDYLSHSTVGMGDVRVMYVAIIIGCMVVTVILL